MSRCLNSYGVLPGNKDFVLRKAGGTAELEGDRAAGRGAASAAAAGWARRFAQAQDVWAVGGEVLLAFGGGAKTSCGGAANG
jgi:hypothetical protein